MVSCFMLRGAVSPSSPKELSTAMLSPKVRSVHDIENEDLSKKLAALPESMKAFACASTYGDAEAALEEVTTRVPTLLQRDILVRIEAVGVNPVDTKVRGARGEAKPVPETQQPHILGYDGVGVVVACGPEASLFKVGDRVYFAGDISRNGTNAEYTAVDERICGFAPTSLGAEAAAVPLTLLTAWEGLFERLGIQPFAPENAGKSILVLPGAGGVGSFVVQLAKKLGGLTVIATASRPQSKQAVLDLGADHAINHREPLRPQLEACLGAGATGAGCVDYIYNAFDTSAYFEQYCDIIKPLGKIVTIVETSENLNMSKLQAKSATFVWELMFTRALFGVEMERQHAILNNASRLIDEGLLKLPSVKVRPYTLENLREAHREQESGKVIGKLLLSMQAQRG